MKEKQIESKAKASVKDFIGNGFAVEGDSSTVVELTKVITAFLLVASFIGMLSKLK